MANFLTRVLGLQQPDNIYQYVENIGNGSDAEFKFKGRGLLSPPIIVDIKTGEIVYPTVYFIKEVIYIKFLKPPKRSEYQVIITLKK